MNVLALGLLTWALVWAFVIGTVMVFVAIGLSGFNGEKIARFFSDGRKPDEHFVRFIENLVFFLIVGAIVIYLIVA